MAMVILGQLEGHQHPRRAACGKAGSLWLAPHNKLWLLTHALASTMCRILAQHFTSGMAKSTYTCTDAALLYLTGLLLTGE